MKAVLFALAASMLLASVPCWGRDVPTDEFLNPSSARLVCPRVCSPSRWNGNYSCRSAMRPDCVCGCEAVELVNPRSPRIQCLAACARLSNECIVAEKARPDPIGYCQKTALRSCQAKCPGT